MTPLHGFTIAALTLSSTATADFEAGAHAGYTMMDAKEATDTASGPALGVRVGMGVGLGLTPEINITRYSATPEEGGESATLTQIQTGLGARFYVGDFFVRPFVGGHLNYAMAATTAAGSEVTDSSGLGVDVGGGLQLKFLDLITTELQGCYARTFTNAAISNIYAGLGVGVKL